MTTQNDIQSLQNEVKSMKDYPIKLTWKMIGVCATTAVTVVGFAFGLGLKIETEAGKIKLYHQEREFQKQLADKDNILIETNRKLKESTEEIIYLSNRYDSMKDKLQKCLDGNNFIFGSPNGKDNN